MAGTTSQPEQNWWEIKTPPLALFLFLLLSSALGGGTRHPRGNLSTIGETDRITGTIPFYHAPVHKRVKLSTHRTIWQWYQRKSVWSWDEMYSSAPESAVSVFFFCHRDDGSGYDAAADKTITRASLWHFDWNHPFSGDTIWQENLIATWFEEQTKFWVAVSEAVSFSVSGKISCRTNVDWRHDVPSMDWKGKQTLKAALWNFCAQIGNQRSTISFWIALKVCQH